MAKLKHKKIIICLTVAGGIVVSIFIAFFIYVGIYYHASADAKTIAASDTTEYKISKLKGGDIAFIPENASVGLIFYPGGKVEYTAYAPLMAEFAKRGVMCVLVKMPFNLAVFDSDAAKNIQAAFPDVEHWYIGGHSLGGAMAASYLAKHVSDYDGLLLLGAYSTKDISSTGIKCLSAYGSNDGVLNMKKYEANKTNLPNGFDEYVIPGGCHSYFGDYGTQKGDGTPTISRSEQMALVAAWATQRMK